MIYAYAQIIGYCVAHQADAYTGKNNIFVAQSGRHQWNERRRIDKRYGTYQNSVAIEIEYLAKQYLQNYRAEDGKENIVENENIVDKIDIVDVDHIGYRKAEYVYAIQSQVERLFDSAQRLKKRYPER